MIRISGACLPNGKKTDLVIEDSKIKSVCLASGNAGEGIDGTGLVVLPGMIDPHVHFRIPGDPQKEDWQHGSAAAIRGGVTTVFDMPNTKPPLISIARLEEKRGLIGASWIKSRFWFGATADNSDEIKKASRERDVIGVKVFMGSSTGDLLVEGEEALRRIFSLCASLGLVVGVHAEDEGMMRQSRRDLGRDPLVSDHAALRSAEAEVSAVRRALWLARETGVRLYLCHVSTPEALALAVEARAAGQTVFVEVSPHHLILDEKRLRGPEGAFFKMNPPLRRTDQVIRLRLALRNDSIDTIGSDHAPHARQEKQRVNYDDIPSGVPGVETSLLLMLDLVGKGYLTMERLASLTSGRAAEIFGLRSKGRIEAGFDADLVLVDPNAETVFRDEEVASKCGWTPYQRMKVKGAIKIVIIGGRIILSR